MTLISNLERPSEARWMISSTASAAGSSSKNAINAQLSKTLAAMSEASLAFAVFHHGFEHALAFQGTAQAVNVSTRDRLEQNAIACGNDGGLRSLFNFEFLAEFARADYLSLHDERSGFGFRRLVI